MDQAPSEQIIERLRRATSAVAPNAPDLSSQQGKGASELTREADQATEQLKRLMVG